MLCIAPPRLDIVPPIRGVYVFNLKTAVGANFSHAEARQRMAGVGVRELGVRELEDLVGVMSWSGRKEL